MTIEKGAPWGTPGHVPEGSVRASSDRAAAESDMERVVVLTAGDLHRGVGQPRPKEVGEACTLLPVDVLEVKVTTGEGETTFHRAVGHVCLGHFVSARGFTGLVNAGFVDGLNLAPRGHPGDGRVELVVAEAKMPWRQRMMARRRARTGSHLPHPSIRVSAVQEWTFVRQNDETLSIDGHDLYAWSEAAVTVRPGLLVVAV